MTAAPHMAEALTKAAFELAAQVLDDHGDSAATEALGQRLCCSGQDCGCRGATVGEYLQHLIRSMTFSDLPADVITATANQAVRFGMEARDRAEIALSLAIESQTEGEWQPSTRQAHELFEAVLASLPAPDEKDAEIARLREALDRSQRFEAADWYWRTMDPDDCGDSPEEAINRAMVGQFCVCEIASSFTGPTRYGFIAPVVDPESDDEEFVHFATQQEAIDAAKASLTTPT